MSPFQRISFRYAYQTQFQIYSANAIKHKHIAKTQSSIVRAEKQHKRYHQLTYEKKKTSFLQNFAPRIIKQTN